MREVFVTTAPGVVSVFAARDDEEFPPGVLVALDRNGHLVRASSAAPAVGYIMTSGMELRIAPKKWMRAYQRAFRRYARALSP